MIASHSDADNIGGLPEVMNNIKVKTFMHQNPQTQRPLTKIL